MPGRIFYSIGKSVFDSPRTAICIIAVVIVLTSLPMANLKIDSSLDRYLKSDSPDLLAYHDFRATFGDSPQIVYGISGPNIFSSDFLNRLKTFQRDIKLTIPFVSRQESLLTLKVVKKEKDRLIVYAPLNEMPDSAEERQKRIQEIQHAHIYKHLFFNALGDFSLVMVSIDPCLSSQYIEADELEGFSDNLHGIDKTPAAVCTLTSAETRELFRAANEAAKAHSGDGFEIHLTGMPVYKEFVKQTLIQDAVSCVLLAGTLILFLLYFFFRRLTGVLFPFLIVIFSMTTTMGIMGFMESPVKMPTSILPTLILVVGIGDSIHVLARYFQFLDMGIGREQAILSALNKSGTALFITSVTTIAGIASFSGANVAPVADLGMYGSIGVASAFIYTIILLPAFIALCPEPGQARIDRNLFGSLNRFFEAIAIFSCKNAKKIVFTGICITLLCTVGIMQLKMTHNPMVWLPHDADIRIASETIDQNLGGIISMEVLIRVKESKGKDHLTTLKSMELLRQQLKAAPIESVTVNQTRSVVDIVALARKAPEENAYTERLPRHPSQLSSELALIEVGAPAMFREVTAHGMHTMRFTAYMPWMDAVIYAPFLDRVKSICNGLFNNGEEITITGKIPLLVKTLSETIDAMVKSYLICGVVISGMMIILMRKASLGMLGMIPNLVPVWLSLGIMGWSGFPLDMYTLLVGSIALGLIVDDTVHFMHYFKSHHRYGQSISRTCIMTLQSAGPPMLMTTILIIAGALAFTLASLNSLKYFGTAIAGVSFLALICDLFIMPALMTLVLGRVSPSPKKG